jgi:hypothetical protein
MRVQALMLDNPHSFPVEYDWALSSPVFTVTPRTGIVKPRSSCQALVKWTPGAPGGKAAAQQPLLQPLEPPAKPAAASQQASASGPAAGPKLRKSTSSIKQLAGSVAGDAAAGEASKATSSRPLSKESSSKQAATAASQHSQSPSTEATAAGRNRRASGSQAGGLPANSSSITVELPAEPAPAAAAAAAAVGCQHTGFMTLKLKGGGDVCPKRVVLFGELPASQLKIAVKEVNVGPVPLFEQQMVLVQIKNAGSTDATFRVSCGSVGHLLSLAHVC